MYSGNVAVASGGVVAAVLTPNDRPLIHAVIVVPDARPVSVTHELRSPLTTLAASLSVIEARREELPERSRQALDLVIAEVRRFQRMVGELLEISRFDAGSADIEASVLEVGELVRRAVAASGKAGVPVQVDPAVEGRPVIVDKRRIERVMTNLLENAEHYAGGATRVLVAAHDAAVRIAVEDDGPGIPAAERDRVFERFARGATVAGRRGAGHGTGLGLALVSEHVKLHGGRVWVEEAPSGGARFVVELPLVEPEEAPELPDAEGAEPVGSPERDEVAVATDGSAPRSDDGGRTRNRRDAGARRAERAGALGNRVLPGALAAPAHHEQVAGAEVEPERATAPARAEEEPTTGAERHDRHDRVLARGTSDGVPVPLDAVSPVPVEAEPDGPQRLTELRQVAVAQRGPHLGEHGVRQHVALVVEALEPGHVDHPVVHAPALRPPRHARLQVVEERSRAADPPAPDVQPGAPGKHPARHAPSKRPQHHLVARGEERALEHRRPC